jgi:hypothetical protein
MAALITRADAQSYREVLDGEDIGDAGYDIVADNNPYILS